MVNWGGRQAVVNFWQQGLVTHDPGPPSTPSKQVRRENCGVVERENKNPFLIAILKAQKTAGVSIWEQEEGRRREERDLTNALSSSFFLSLSLSA